MTAMNLIVQQKKRAAYLISDCAYTFPDGRIEKIHGKLISFERFPAAIGTMGNVHVHHLAPSLFAADVKNVRSLLKVIPACMKAGIRLASELHPSTTDFMCTLKIAVYDVRAGRPRGYVCTSDELTASLLLGPSKRPFELIEVHDSPSWDVPLEQLLGRPVADVRDPAHFDPHQHAFELVAAQRRRPQTSLMKGLNAAAQFRIGGEVEMTEVSRKGVKVWKVGEFPDSVGRMIDPSADERQAA